jgi:hypothetical protein
MPKGADALTRFARAGSLPDRGRIEPNVLSWNLAA